jgi:hypothetical protein
MGNSDVIPEDVKQFIFQYIDSIALMEGLLLFLGNPSKEWGTKAIADELFINEEQAEQLLKRLKKSGFVSSSKTHGYLYQPKPDLKDIAERVALLYRQYLIPMTNLIHTASKSRIQEFADAFKIRKD